MDKILETIYREGAVSKSHKEITLKKSPKNFVMPDYFYSTTNNHTQVFHKGEWIQVENMMMDKCIVVKGKKAFCVPVRDVKKGDQDNCWRRWNKDHTTRTSKRRSKCF